MVKIYFMSRLWPTYASAHNNLGTLMTGTDEAESHFLAAIRYSPNHVNAHYNLGQVYSAHYKPRTSLQVSQYHFLAIIRYSTNLFNAHYNLGQVFSTPNRDSNLNIPTTSNLVYYDIDSLDHEATEACQTNASLRAESQTSGSKARLIFWDVGLEPGQQMLEDIPETHGIVTFVDDLLIVVECSSRKSLEEICNRVLDGLGRWCKSIKLKMALEKTAFMLFRARYVRNPAIRSRVRT
uniref:Reverse transcriptase domain-containing protein n=1 Tax=Timema douglasi TaxID=61478 RepID=A0A7R8ZAD3_TIMDO|nr:unnamed protein product [Timema douglasi]